MTFIHVKSLIVAISKLIYAEMNLKKYRHNYFSSKYMQQVGNILHNIHAYIIYIYNMHIHGSQIEFIRVFRTLLLAAATVWSKLGTKINSGEEIGPKS